MLKRVVGFNGSGRKNGNTAQLVKSFLDGAASVGAKTELVHLGDLNFKGCAGCLSCRLVGEKGGTCRMKDDLTKYLDACESYDAICIGTPIFWMGESGMARCLIERMLFQYLTYDTPMSRYKGHAKMALLGTMNITKEYHENMLKAGTPLSTDATQNYMKIIFGNCETLYAYDTLQCNDYKKYHIVSMDEKKKREHHEKQFPIDLKKAFDLGVKLVRESNHK